VALASQSRLDSVNIFRTGIDDQRIDDQTVNNKAQRQSQDWRSCYRRFSTLSILIAIATSDEGVFTEQVVGRLRKKENDRTKEGEKHRVPSFPSLTFY